MKTKTYESAIKSTDGQTIQLGRLEKQISDGKLFWIIKRMSAWLSILLFLFGAIAIIYPAILNIESKFIGIAVGMFTTFLINSMMEWSKMEKQFEEAKTDF